MERKVSPTGKPHHTRLRKANGRRAALALRRTDTISRTRAADPRGPLEPGGFPRVAGRHSGRYGQSVRPEMATAGGHGTGRSVYVSEPSRMDERTQERGLL